MCGIAGLNLSGEVFSDAALKKMTSSLTHRGPDACDFFKDEYIALGHNRLSILDLSEKANQPMHSHCGRYIIVYNGEVYNYKDIAGKLNRNWRTHCDTEVLIEAFAEWGTDFVNHTNGMFALAIYDKEKNDLFLFRDRMGIKPLYYFRDGKDFAFASELKALLKLDIPKEIHPEALKDYLFLEYVPQQQSIIKNIYKLPPGHYLKFSKGKTELKKYYDILEQLKENETLSEGAHRQNFEEIFARSVEMQKISDVPIGAFLSGGTDSSLVCAEYQKSNATPIKTFNIGFDVPAYDESHYAKAVAEVLQTDHSSFSIQEKDTIQFVEDIVNQYDEPFAAPSTIPSLLVCQKAREVVKVAMSGDGGDELFMGYGYYNWMSRIKSINKIGGKAGRKALSAILEAAPNRYKRAAQLLNFPEEENFWLHVWSQEQYMFSEKEISELLDTSYRHETLKKDWEEINRLGLHDFEKVSLLDIKNYLPYDLLYKMDIASMANSLEVRVPFLDHNVVECAVNIPWQLKIRKGEQKYLLKKILESHLPKELIYRKKWGFPAPVGEWMKGDLSYLIDKYLNTEELITQGIFNVGYVKQLIRKFKTGEGFCFKKVWALIVFQIWYNRYMK